METNNFKHNLTKNSITISCEEYEKLLKMQAVYEAVQSTNKALQSQLEWCESIIRALKKDRFGAKSEKITKQLVEQIPLLFDEIETTAYVEAVETEETKEVKAHSRKVSKPQNNLMESIPAGTPIEVFEHYLEDIKCPNCGAELEIIGKKIYKHLVLIPAQYKVREDVCYTYACKECPENGSNVTVIEAPLPKQVIPGSYATEEAIAHIAVQKFSMGSPMYRLEEDYHRQGLRLSRQTMSNWLIKATDMWLKPIYEELHRRLLKEEILMADETTVQVLHEEGRRPQSKSYMWLYRTGQASANPIVLYKYEQTRSGTCPTEFLQGFKGYLQTDGYKVYHNLGPEVINVGCLAHARRYFYEAMKNGKGVSQTAAKAVGYFTRISKIEGALDREAYDIRYTKRLELEKPLLDELFAWAKTLYAAPKSKLGEAITYLLNQEKYLRRYLLDGRLETTNNRSERSIKPFVIARKNFLFANTPNGAETSAILFRLIETAKENHLDPYRYLVYALKKAVHLDQKGDNWVEALLPESAPDECKSNAKLN